jgi:hypothetical protein
MRAFHLKTIGLSILFGSALVAACGDDEDTTTGPTSGPTSTASSTTTSSTASAGGSTSSAGGSTASAGGGGSSAGGNGAGGGSMAQQFCDKYEADCGYGMDDRYEDEAACIAAFDAAGMGCQTCWTMHLGFVESMGLQHCAHACNDDQCNSCDNVCQ